MSPASANAPPPRERPVKGLDHLLIVAHDLEAVRRTYERLGFKAAPRGRHIGWGTANYCLMLERDYLELLGIVDDSQFLNGLDATLATRGEGLSAAAFAADDLDRSAKLLRESDVNVGDPQDLKRTIEAKGGDLLPRFQLLHLPRDVTPGLPAFICKHHTPELVWQRGWSDQPNGRGRRAVRRHLRLPLGHQHRQPGKRGLRRLPPALHRRGGAPGPASAGARLYLAALARTGCH